MSPDLPTLLGYELKRAQHGAHGAKRKVQNGEEAPFPTIRTVHPVFGSLVVRSIASLQSTC
jgi:hypothetical protein